MDRWTWVLLGIAAYIAVVSLVRMMTWWRNQRWEEFRKEMELRRSQKPPAAGAKAPAKKAA